MNTSDSKRGETAYFLGYTTVAVFVFKLASSSHTLVTTEPDRTHVPRYLELCIQLPMESHRVSQQGVCLCVCVSQFTEPTDVDSFVISIPLKLFFEFPVFKIDGEKNVLHGICQTTCTRCSTARIGDVKLHTVHDHPFVRISLSRTKCSININ